MKFRLAILFLFSIAANAMAQQGTSFTLKPQKSSYVKLVPGAIIELKQNGMLKYTLAESVGKPGIYSAQVKHGVYDIYVNGTLSETKWIGSGEVSIAADAFSAQGKLLNSALQDSGIGLNKLTTAAVNFIGSGGSITNNPDDVTIQNLTGTQIGVNRNIFISSASYTNIHTAIDSAAAHSYELRITRAEAVSKRDTIPSNVTLRIERNGMITGADSLWIDGPFFAGAYQTFAAGMGVVFGSSATWFALPEWFGAKRDGITDDSAALNRAINSISRSSDVGIAGNKLLLMEGVYGIAAPVSIPQHVVVEGRGRFSSQLKATGDNTVLNISSNYCSLRDLYVKGTDNTPTKATIEISGSFHVFENLDIQGGRFATRIINASYVNFRDVTFTGSDSALVFIPENSIGSVIHPSFEHCRFLQSNNIGLLMESDYPANINTGVDVYYVADCEFSQIDSVAIYLRNAGQGEIYRTDVSFGSFKRGIKIENSWEPRVRGCEIEQGNVHTPPISNTIGIELLNQSSARISGTTVSVFSTDAVAFKLSGSTDNKIFNCVASADSIGVWMNNSKNNTINGVSASNVDVGFFENNGSINNRYPDCYAKTLLQPGKVGFLIDNTSWAPNARISGSVDGGAELPFITGSGYVGTFSANNPTPSVFGTDVWRTNNTIGTTITAIDSATSYGKRFRIIFGDDSTTVAFGTNIKGNGGVNWSPSNGEWMDCVREWTSVYCEPSDNWMNSNRRLKTSNVVRADGGISVKADPNNSVEMYIADQSIPQIVLDEQLAPFDEKLWDFRVTGGQLNIKTVNDGFTADQTALRIYRTGYTVNSVTIEDAPLGFKEQADPATPPAGYSYVWTGTDGILRQKDDAGVVRQVGNVTKEKYATISAVDSIQVNDEIPLGKMPVTGTITQVHGVTDAGTVTFSLYYRAKQFSASGQTLIAGGVVANDVGASTSVSVSVPAGNYLMAVVTGVNQTAGTPLRFGAGGIYEVR